MVLLRFAAAKWRCGRVRLPNGAAGVCGCRMALRGVRLPNVAAGVEGALRLCRAVFLCVLCSFIRIDSVLSPLCSPTVTCLLMNTALTTAFLLQGAQGAKPQTPTSEHPRLGRLRAKGAATPLPRPVEVGDRRSSVCASREGLRHGDRLVPRAAGSASWPGEGGPEREFATPPYRSTPPLATTGKKMAPCPSSG